MNFELKIARTRAELSQHRLAIKTGINQPTLSAFEQDYKKPNQEQARLIAEALNINANDIFSDIRISQNARMPSIPLGKALLCIDCNTIHGGQSCPCGSSGPSYPMKPWVDNTGDGILKKREEENNDY